ncbi:MAG: hypothetical protein HY721_21080 [Planctomycetes bacterium]|nr:hypothetical protein [Planctomycetota bacterium]
MSATITIEVPVARCYEYVKGSVPNEKFQKACWQVWKREYSGRITQDDPQKLLTVTESGVSLLRRLRPSGWRVSYSFNGLSESVTEIRVSGEMSLGLAVLAFPLARLKAQNEILQKVRELLAFEAGTRAQR